MHTKLVFVLTLALVLSMGVATPAAASHPCLDGDICPSHDPPHPKSLVELVRCLILAQPPIACV